MQGGGAQLQAIPFLESWVLTPAHQALAPQGGRSRGGMLVVWELRWPQGQVPLLTSCLEATQTGDRCVWPLCPQMLVHQGAAGGARPGSGEAGSRGDEEERGLRVGTVVWCGSCRLWTAVGAGLRPRASVRQAGNSWMISTSTDSRDGENKGGFEMF